MMDLGSNNNLEEKAIKNSSLLLIKSAAQRGPAAAPSQRGLQVAQKKGAPAPQKRRRCHQVEWSGPDLYTQVLPPSSSSTSVPVTKSRYTPSPLIVAPVTPYQESLYVILSLRTVERRWCYWQVISIHVLCPCHQQEIKRLNNSKCLEFLRPKKVAWIRVRKGGWWLGDSGNTRKKTKLSLHIFPKGSRKMLLCPFRWQRRGMLCLVWVCWWELNYQFVFHLRWW